MSATTNEVVKTLLFSKPREKTRLKIQDKFQDRDTISPNFNERADAFTPEGTSIKEEEKRIPIPNGMPDTLVLHYTACDLKHALEIFQTPDKTSAHYTVDTDGAIYFHVREDKRAWHAGVSWWQGRRDNNSYSIGIEQVNFGYKEHFFQPDNGVRVKGSEKEWYPFELALLTGSLALSKDIVEYYKITPWKVLGHSDVAPGRK